MPTKELKKSSKYWNRRRLQKYAENEKKSETYIKNIQSLYEKANKDIDKMISNVYFNYSKDTGLDVQKLKELLTKSESKKTWKELEKKGLDKYIKDNYKSRITRLEQIKAQVYERAKDIYPKEDFTQTELYKSVINDSYYKAIYNVQRGTGIGFSFNKLDNNVMNNLLSEKWSGANYSERIWTNTDILAKELSEVIGSALIGGRGAEVTAKEIRDRFSVAKHYAERLVRTEMNYYDNQADAMAYEEMGIDEFVPVATLDNRTSAYCAEIDGKHFKYSEMEIGVNYPPFHPNCRCTTRGFLGKETEKMLTRRARNPVTGGTETIPNMTYNEWAKRNSIPFKENGASIPTKVIDDNNILSNQIKTRTDEVFEKYKENGFENLSLITADGKERIGEISNIKSVSSVDYSGEQKELMKSYKRELIAIHNHPANSMPSVEDFYEAINNDALCGIIVRTNKYNYYFLPKIDDLDVYKGQFKEFIEWFEQALPNEFDKNSKLYDNMGTSDRFHTAYKRIFERIGWKYGREKR